MDISLTYPPDWFLMIFHNAQWFKSIFPTEKIKLGLPNWGNPDPKSSKMKKSKFLIIDRVKDLVLLQKLTSLGHVKKWHKPFSMWFFLSSESGSGVVCSICKKSFIEEEK